ncbi:hypothetical protein ACEUZ9_001345 [Paracoccus litorisediminis]|uniref:hypothetical protein n=1 Tax=Paracoccus litorisediminis TaxID=2006130 RepID=UPI00372DD92F
MLHRRVQPPTVDAGDAHVTLSRHLATRAAKIALDTISKGAKGLPDLQPTFIIPALRDLHHLAREADALIKRVSEVSKHLTTTADALDGGYTEGDGPLVTVALEIFATNMYLREIDANLDLSEAVDAADRLREVAGLVADDVAKARDRIALVRDLLAEAVDLALTFDRVDPSAVLSEFRPTARMRQELDLKNAILPETIRAIARATVGAKRKEGSDRRLAKQAKTRRDLQVAISDAWKGPVQ